MHAAQSTRAAGLQARDLRQNLYFLYLISTEFECGFVIFRFNFKVQKLKIEF